MKGNIPSIDSIREDQLKSRFLAGDDEAFGKLYKLFSKGLYALGLSLQVNPALIEDAIHDVFEDIYRHKHRLNKVDKIKYYFFTAFRNRLFYLLKEEKNQKEKEENYTEFKLNELGALENVSINDEGLRKKEVMKKLLKELTTKQKEVIHYRFIEGMTIEEISIVMGINNQSVKNLIYRTMKKIEILKESKSSMMI